MFWNTWSVTDSSKPLANALEPVVPAVAFEICFSSAEIACLLQALLPEGAAGRPNTSSVGVVPTLTDTGMGINGSGALGPGTVPLACTPLATPPPTLAVSDVPVISLGT